MTLTIREALPDEYDAVGELTVRSFIDVILYGAQDPYLEILRNASKRGEQAELLVALDEGGALVGTVTVGRFGTEYADIARPGEIEVRMLAVDPATTHQGIGRALMRHIHETAAREDFARVVLSVIGTNTVAAKFYTSLGYTRVPDRDWQPWREGAPALEVFEFAV